MPPVSQLPCFKQIQINTNRINEGRINETQGLGDAKAGRFL